MELRAGPRHADVRAADAGPLDVDEQLPWSRHRAGNIAHLGLPGCGDDQGAHWLTAAALPMAPPEPLVDESPGGAVLGTIMPRTNWLLVNRLRLSDLLHGEPPPPDEGGILSDYVRAPPAEQIGRLVEGDLASVRQRE